MVAKACSRCGFTFDAKRKEKRCTSCRYTNVVCKNCGVMFSALFRDKRTKTICSLRCLGIWSAKNRVNPSRTELAKKNMSDALYKAYAEGRKVSWNKLDIVELTSRKKFRRFMGSVLHRMLDEIGNLKKESIIRRTGYSAAQLKEHIESLWKPGMTWENYGNKKGQWDIDHVMPISSFSLDTHPSVVNALSNLCPMWAEENLHKGFKIEKVS